MRNPTISLMLLIIMFLTTLEISIAKESNMDDHTRTNDSSWEWNTFLGGDNRDYGNSIATDKDGNVYIVGTSSSSWGSPVDTFAGGSDAFAAKLNSNGELQWVTFLGSDNFNYGESVAVDDEGNVYIAGRSYLTWGTPVNEYAGAFGYEAFAAKLNSNGELQWNTFIGSANKEEFCQDMAIDGSGNVYLVGSSKDTWGTPVNAFAGEYDAFAAKINNNGELQWHTFLGSAGNDRGNAIAIDFSGNVYVTGYSYNTWGSPIDEFAETEDVFFDAFAAKLNSNGVLQWNTFIGSSGNDSGEDIVVCSSGNIYLTGYSKTSWGSPVNDFSQEWDSEGFVVKLNNNGSKSWNTFMGSSFSDKCYGIALDGNNNIYVAGESDASWGAPVNTPETSIYPDAFAAKLDPNGNRLGNTFFGSSDEDQGESIDVDNTGNIYVVGTSYITWGSPVTEPAGNYEAFAIKLGSSDIISTELNVSQQSAPSHLKAYPNPINKHTLISYDLSADGYVSIKVYDIHGKELEVLVDQFQAEGKYIVPFDASHLTGGIYFYKLKIGKDYTETKTLIILE